MAVILKLLAAVQGLSSNTGGVQTDLSPSGSSTKGWLIKSLVFYNTSTTGGENVTIDFKVKKAGTYRMLHKAALSALAPNTSTTLQKEITLDLNADVLAVVVSSSTGTPLVNCIASGVERDQ